MRLQTAPRGVLLTAAVVLVSVLALTGLAQMRGQSASEYGAAPTVPGILATFTLTPSVTPTPTATFTPSATPTPTVTPTPSVTPQLEATANTIRNDADNPNALPTATPPPRGPGQVNGLAYTDFVVMPPEVIANIRRIFARGQAMGRNPQMFTRIGDSTIDQPHFFTRFDSGPYNLGPYADLERVLDQYRGAFAHESVAVRIGLHSWSVFDPTWADAARCQPGEHMLACEFRITNPSLIFIRLGSNDRGVPESTERNLRQIVEYSIDNGVVPIIGTKADRFDGPGNVNNTILRSLAAEYEVPLWDFDRVAGTIPGRGLGPDQVHMTTFYAHDWTQPRGFSTGHGLHNLTGLIMLDAVRVALADAERLDPVTANLRYIYNRGMALGNRRDTFSKVGDSITVSDRFLVAVGEGRAQFGPHNYLQPLVDLYRQAPARDGNPLTNRSLAAGEGWSAWAVHDPTYANPAHCEPGESPLVCEYRRNRPAMAIVMFGTNDAGYRSASQFRDDMQRVIDVSVDMGVIPLLSTIPEQPTRPDAVAALNAVITDLTAANDLPVIDLYAALAALPDHGLSYDNIHPSTPPGGYTDTAIFTGDYMQYGYNVRNITALQALYVIRQQVGLNVG